MEWAHETKRVLHSAKVPPKVKFYNIYGTKLETPHSVCYGNKKMPVKDLTNLSYFQADGLEAVARVGVPGEHRGILNDHRVFRMLKQCLNVGEPNPFYNPINDCVILPTTFEMEGHHENGMQVVSVRELWDITSDNNNNNGTATSTVSSISVSRPGDDQNP